MFKFHDPRLQNYCGQQPDQQQLQNKLDLEAGEELRGVSEVDSICSVTDTDGDDIDSDNSNRKQFKVMKHIFEIVII